MCTGLARRTRRRRGRARQARAFVQNGRQPSLSRPAVLR